jgi:hypothetical protein
VLYTRTRDSGFRNPSAFGENLVMLSPDAEDVELVSDPVLYSWAEDDLDLFTSVNLHEVGRAEQQPPYARTHPVLR